MRRGDDYMWGKTRMKAEARDAAITFALSIADKYKLATD